MYDKNNVLIILGMHRSGTSLVAQWLHQCGLHLGDRLIGASVGNEKGHYEDLDFHDLHEQIFRANGISYGGLEKIAHLNINTRQKAKFQSLIERKNKSYKIWGWKDPRTCLFVDIYEELIEFPTYLIMFRNANEVLNSLLVRREKMISSQNYLSKIITEFKNQTKLLLNKHDLSLNQIIDNYTISWIEYNERILNFTKKIEPERYKVIHYKTLLKNSKQIISWLNERNFNLQNVPFEDIFCPDMIAIKDLNITIDYYLRDRVKNIEEQFLQLEKQV